MENLKVSGDIPQARFGHTITLVSKTKAVLFGGATGDTGKYIITGDAYLFDCLTKKWKKLEPTGQSPTARAAHASTTVETNQLVIYGGATGGGQLASDELFLLDLRGGETNSQWIPVSVVGSTPGRRYGHTIAFSKPFLIVYGGNTGNEPVNDVWALSVEKSPFSWAKLTCDGDSPCVRVYHSAALCSTGTANGMMVIFGGRTADQSALNDTWGLRRHRDGRWDWVRAPYKQNNEPPLARYQHSTLFVASLMYVIGGRTNNVGENVPLEVYDCESSEWTKYPSIQRFRHACWILDNNLYIHGGFEQDSPNVPTEVTTKLDIAKFTQSSAIISPKLNIPTTTTGGMTGGMGGMTGGMGGMTGGMGGMGGGMSGGMGGMGGGMMGGSPLIGSNNNGTKPLIDSGKMIPETSTKDYRGFMEPGPMQKKPMSMPTQNQNIRISDKVVIAVANDNQDDRDKMIRHVSIDKLQEESKKIKFGGIVRDPQGQSNPMLYYEHIYAPFINAFLKPTKEWLPPNEYKFPFKRDQIVKLIEETNRVIANQPTVLQLRVPTKIYGSLHGQYGDLMRLFDHWGGPTDHGDIDSFDYLFLGNYVDRGKYSLELLCLLLALKLKYPDQLHMLRGSHEDITMNRNYGFGDECQVRLGENVDDQFSVFYKFNELFMNLPLAAVVENKILCVHSGIGNSIRTIDDIYSIPRPIDVVHDQGRLQTAHQMLVDLLWSDPDDGTTQQKYVAPNAAKFGTDRLRQFLGDNNLTMLVRSHECVVDGFDKSPNGQLITVFSATNYCGKFTNHAAVVVLRKNFDLVPKVITPLVTSTSSMSYGMDDEKSFKGKMSYGGGNYMGTNSNQSTNSSWIDTEETLKKRPATPPRMSSKGGVNMMKKI